MASSSWRHGEGGQAADRATVRWSGVSCGMLWGGRGAIPTVRGSRAS
jgi:hypothetical protein